MVIFSFWVCFCILYLRVLVVCCWNFNVFVWVCWVFCLWIRVCFCVCRVFFFCCKVFVCVRCVICLFFSVLSCVLKWRRFLIFRWFVNVKESRIILKVDLNWVVCLVRKLCGSILNLLRVRIMSSMSKVN